jgi:hypothetical protein
MLTAFVDLANISLLYKTRGLVHIPTSIVEAIGARVVASHKIIQLRLYGGWFEGTLLSREAQEWSAQAAAEFPRMITISGDVTARLSTALVGSLLCDPLSVPITHTYRPKSAPRNLHVAQVPYSGCALLDDCPISSLAAFIKEEYCPHPECAVALSAVLSRAEQKLVDAMLIVDLLHSATTSEDPLVLVSSDDDMWPAIRQVLLLGKPLIHIQPERGKLVPARYLPLTTSGYTHCAFR